MREDVGSPGNMSLRTVAVAMNGMRAAGKVAAAVEPRDAFVEDFVARGPAEGFNDWGGRGYDDFDPGEVT